MQEELRKRLAALCAERVTQQVASALGVAGEGRIEVVGEVKWTLAGFDYLYEVYLDGALLLPSVVRAATQATPGMAATGPWEHTKLEPSSGLSKKQTLSVCCFDPRT